MTGTSSMPGEVPRPLAGHAISAGVTDAGRLAELATRDLAVQASIAASHTALRASPADPRGGMSAAKLFRAEARTMLEELADARLERHGTKHHRSFGKIPS